jgi:hypothetical protein
MKRGRPEKVSGNKIALRVLLAEPDYQALVKIAAEERTDVGSLARRAIALQFLVPYERKGGEGHGSQG